MRRRVPALAMLAVLPILACGDSGTTGPGEDDCIALPQSSGSSCWTYLGLENRLVTALERTPWGVVAGAEADVRLGQVYRLDASCGWRPEEDDVVRGRINDFEVLPGAANRLMAATTPGTFPGVGVFASADSGATWVASDDGWGSQFQAVGYADRFLYDGRDPATLFWLNANVVLGTADGSGWAVVSGRADAVSGDLTAAAISPHDTAFWEAGTDIRGDPFVRRSVDRGVTWTDLAAPAVTIIGFWFDPGSVNRVVAATADGFLETTNGGASWDWWPATQSSSVRALAERAGVFYAPAVGGSGAELLVSPTGTASWSAIAGPAAMGDPYLESVEWASDGSLLIGTDDGLWSFDAANAACTGG